MKKRKSINIVLLFALMMPTLINVSFYASELEARKMKEYDVEGSVILESNLYKDDEIDNLEDVAEVQEGTNWGEVSLELTEEPENADVNMESGQVVYEYEDYTMEENNITGGVQYKYDIPSKESQHEFELDMNLEPGNTLKYNELGEIYIADSEGEIVTLIGSPWAVDSEGNFIDTYFELKNDSIKQVINYEGDNYPLQADPLFCSETINNKASYMTDSNTFAVVPNTCAKVYNVVSTVGM